MSEDTNATTSDFAKDVASSVAKELAITVTGCVAALVLTAGASTLVNKIRARRAITVTTTESE